MAELKIIDEGVKDYKDMLDKQRKIFAEMVSRKKAGLSVDEEYLFLVEHNPVLTLGKHAKSANVLMPAEVLEGLGMKIYQIERGGDVTYHGPGQLVAYPLIDLERHRLGVKGYVNLLEESVIRTLSEYGVKGERVAGASGVWIGVGTPAERKICALGVKCSRFVTMHGLALNVNTNLSGFELINPCGFTDKGVTSISEELGHECDMTEVKRRLSRHMENLLTTDNGQ